LIDEYKYHIIVEMNLGKAITSIIIWSAGNFAFGLVQFYILKGANVLGFPEYTPEAVLHEGILMFFCVAISGAVLVDYFIAKPNWHRIANFTVVLFPFVALFLASNIYSTIHFNKEVHADFNALKSYQTVFIIGTALYCIAVKFAIFTRE
jgi:hypothetical protein